MEYFTHLGYYGLFIVSFLAATILPLSSEIVLVALLLSGLPPALLISIATAGNVLGSLTNYALGYWLSKGLVKKWLKFSEQEFERAKQHFARYGILALLFAWVPVIGDPLTVVAGMLRIRLLWFVILVATGKGLRYAVIGYLL